MTEPLEERVRRLEDVAFEGDGLSRSVDRLGLNASALGEALLQVDRNQQQLTRLGQELEVTKSITATKEEVATQRATVRAELLNYRKQVLGRAYLVAVLSLALLGAIGVAFSSYVDNQNAHRYQLCLDSNARGQAVRDYLDTVAANSPSPVIKAVARRTAATFPITDCRTQR